MPISHRRHGQDTTVLYCIVLMPTSQDCFQCSSPHFETGQNSFEIFCHRQCWIVANNTLQDKTVLSCPCRWCELGISRWTCSRWSSSISVQYIQAEKLTLYSLAMLSRVISGDTPCNQYVVMTPLPCQTTHKYITLQTDYNTTEQHKLF